MIKGSVLQEDIKIFNMYVVNHSISNYMCKLCEKHIELQRETDESTIIVRHFNNTHQKWADPAGRKLVIRQLNSTTTSINWI